MARIKILADGKSSPERANAKGKLFETLMAQVLRHNGYRIDRIPNVNYAGMEIDIEGIHILTGTRLYAECKCYETEVDSKKLQSFCGKYMGLWLDDRHCHGLFIAMPGINTHAKGFYKEKYEERSETTLRVLEEDAVLEALYRTNSVAPPEEVARSVDPTLGKPGDSTILYTNRGLFWIQYVIPQGSGIATSLIFFNSQAKAISDRLTVEYLLQLYPELTDFNVITRGGSPDVDAASSTHDEEEVVEVRGSSGCFEYQFPASPEYFVGREAVFQDLDLFASSVVEKKTSARGILFEANSGWGKSSAVLASVDRLTKAGHFAIAVDSRSASSSQFILRVVEHTLKKMHSSAGPLFDSAEVNPITGFDGAVNTLLSLRDALERERKIVFIFLDQFENLFFHPDILARIRNLFLKVCDAQTNLVFGFSWKTDLITVAAEFPFDLRESLSTSSRKLTLDAFSDVEINVLLDKLAEELHSKLRKDLRFFLSEFSQGYPWLLKKLCAHVRSQREAGVIQSEIANNLLNVEQLFQEDLKGLGAEEEDVLKRISKMAPIGVQDLGDEFKPEVVQALVNARLIVRIGNKYDVYWDIFRDYLNSGSVPVQENYILRVQTGALVRALKVLTDGDGRLDVFSFREKAELSEGSFLNVTKDMRLLGLAGVEDGMVTGRMTTRHETKSFDDLLRDHLRERLPRNRLVSTFVDTLQSHGTLSLSEMADLLAERCPYISATDVTWKTYARIFADWMDAADLAIFDGKACMLTHYKPGTELRERQILPARRRSGMVLPVIQYNPIDRVATRLAEALKGERKLEWTGFTKSTVSKALAALEDLDFLVRKPKSLLFTPKGIEFLRHPERRIDLFTEGALRMPSFKAFIDLLNEDSETKKTYEILGSLLKDRLSTDWTLGTAKVYAKILLDWARCASLAPGVFAEKWRKAAPGRGL